MHDEALDNAGGDAADAVGVAPVVAERVLVEVGLQMLGRYRAGMPAETACVHARYPDVLRRARPQRIAALVVAAVGIALLAFGLHVLEFSLARIVKGMTELGRIATLMLPPEFGTNERLVLYLRALGETLSIAFLGTLLAAALAFPFGFLAARNEIGRASCRERVCYPV